MAIFARNRANESVTGAVTVLIALASMTPAPADGQGWSQPRTPDGQPDLQGVWSNATLTPLERPAAFAGREFLTEKELEDKEKALQPRTRLSAGTEAHYDFLQYGLDPLQAKRASSRRTSLIVDPPDGKIPPLTPEAKKRAAARAEARKRMGSFDGPESRSLPGYVAILQEEIHDIRIIPLDGRPHLGPRIRQLMGDSRGRWEGNTLAVDTTNFTDTTNFRGSGENLHVVERFTRVDEETIRYEFTVEDPTTWTRPWKAELSMVKTKGPIFEFACHEGNYGLANNLSGARAQEKAEETAKRSGK